jgi:2-polyprenyl-3-methyl-5-hydroxy-6-metoxy-1,4-benzoquinol methylase
MPSVWLRIEDEEAACPACASARLTHLDVLPGPRRRSQPRMAFVTGCRDCGVVFWNPLPSSDQLAQFYSHDGEWAARRLERTAKLEAAHLRHGPEGRPKKQRRGPRRRDILFEAMQPHVNVLTPAAGRKALDVGCGDGKFLNGLQDLGWDTYGIEPSSDLAFLRHHRLEMPSRDGSFDLIVLHHVLEHVTAPLGLLEELAATLCPGGALFVSVPRLDTLAEHGDFRYCINGRNHPLTFSETCLRGLLARAGLTTVTCLDDPELDRLFSDGRPLRLRLVAIRAASPPALPAQPLAPAIAALRRYARTRGDWRHRWRYHLPVRLRGALLDRGRD